MKTALWTLLAFGFGLLTLAGITGIIAGFRTGLADVALAFVVTIGAGSATRYAWRKARSSRHLEAAGLPERDDRPWRR
ncbi:hypothetical protein ABZ883_26505 [Streptomyces sp. NPDC046977]|uniref:hypothetical protein n=1 Tax=Streptomyces sp. NPDC046977 TaxID=3154703 RepID=UPI0033FF467A